MKNIYAFFDYQQFLRIYYEEKKKQIPSFSFRNFGDKTGLDAGFLVKVLQGKIHLSLKSLDKITEYFRFDRKENEYFETLVRYGRAVSEVEIKVYFEKLLSLKDVDTCTILSFQYELYHKWYYSAIRELLRFYDFKDDFSALAAKLSPSISAKEAKKSVQLLERLDLIRKDDTGYFRQTSKFVPSIEKWKSATIHSFQKEAMLLAPESLDRQAKNVSDISTITISISRKDFNRIRERINDFKQSLLSMTNENEADCEYLINIQAIPLSQIK
jgi:uncharacterized protein (TIGR02147 family)